MEDPAGAPSALAKPDSSGVPERIVAAARRHFAACGYAGASLDRLAREAGVTKPMVHYYFGSKEGLFAAVYDSELEALLARCRTALASGETAEAQLVGLARTLEEPESLRFFAGCGRDGAPIPDQTPVVALLSQAVAEVLERGRQRGELGVADPTLLASALLGAATILSQRGGGTEGLTRLVSLLLDGVRASRS